MVKAVGPVAGGEDGFDARFLFEDNWWGVLLADAESAVVREANPMACGVLRRKRQDIVGHAVDPFDPSDERSAAAWEEQRRTGRFEGVLRLLRGDGTSIDAEVIIASYSTREGGSGKGDGLCVAYRDEVVRRAARDPAEWDTSPLRYAADLVVVFEENGAMRYASPSLELILGYKPEEFVGEQVRDVVHPDDLPGIIDIFWYPERADTPLAFRCRHKNGGWVHLEGEGHYWPGATYDRDVTERTVPSREFSRFRRVIPLQSEGCGF